jgi:hypothetical protein
VLDAAAFGKPEGKPVAYTDCKGDPRKCFWYLDRELAVSVTTKEFMRRRSQPGKDAGLGGSVVVEQEMEAK